jgi:hypothetical protein
MRHFYRTHLTPADAVRAADAFFAKLGLTTTVSGDRTRTYRGVVGMPDVEATVHLTVRSEGGHYTFVEAETDQMGESRVDRNVKRFFVELHRLADHAHGLEAAY